MKVSTIIAQRLTFPNVTPVFRTVYFLLQVMIKACEKVGVQFNPQGCVVAIEGPRFSTKAESRMFQTWGGDVINMSAVPEVALAKEAGLSYASLAMITDYDCWRNEGETVRIYFLQKLSFVEILSSMHDDDNSTSLRKL